MDSTVGARPNHYETLGVAPAASAAEIGQAFARKLSLFGALPVAEVAELSVAYETLRDPAKRRAYDASLRPASPPALGYTARWTGLPFSGSAVVASPKLNPQAQPEVAVEQKPEPFIASPSPEPARETAVELAPRPLQQRRPEPLREERRAIPRAVEPSSTAFPEERPIQWNKTAIAIGGAVVGVAALGAVAGWAAGLVDQSPEPETRTTVALPPAKPRATAETLPPAPAWSADETLPEQPRKVARITRIERTPSAPASVALAEPQAEASPAEPTQSDAAVADAAQAEAVPASLSIPNGVVARTIGRIGYPCGAVVSTTAVGAGGVFKVTCTSGHTYQASPVRGRYHFRRWGSR